jgi:ribosomal protein L24
MRGDNKGFEGKDSRVDHKAYRIYIEGLTREKVNGTNIFLAVHPSKVQIRNLNLDDKYRKETILGRKTAPGKKGTAKAKSEKAKKTPAKAKEDAQKAQAETEEE